MSRPIVPSRAIVPSHRITRIAVSAILTLASFLAIAEETRSASREPLELAAEQAISGRDGVARRAIARLREAGPEGLETMLRVHAEVLSAGETHSQWAKLSAAIDQVAAQRDAHASGLYWYTDVEQAKAAARASGKPILSLALLGRLDEELSCANSRLFRSVLYPDLAVSKVLRERFVLHWRSVRPVPQVRVDFGDGRVLERTLTGNSIHYVLDSEGRPVEAIPGLWGPRAFLEELDRAEQLVQRLAGRDESSRGQELTRYHARELERLDQAWQAAAGPSDETAQKLGKLSTAGLDIVGPGDVSEAPSAYLAAGRAMSKMAIELPLVASLSRPDVLVIDEAEVQVWPRIETLERQTIQLDSGSTAMIERKLEPARGGDEASRRARALRSSRVLERLQSNLAADQARNRFRFQRTIHGWFAAGAVADLASLNERIYAELFLTPASDPWLGLAPEDAYAAIDAEGKRSEARGR